MTSHAMAVIEKAHRTHFRMSHELVGEEVLDCAGLTDFGTFDPSSTKPVGVARSGDCLPVTRLSMTD